MTATLPAPADGATAGEVMLRLENVHTYYGHIHALQGITMEVRRGEVVTLIGSNGAGKTTTLKTISGLLHPREGNVFFEGADISRTAAHHLVKLGIGHAPEGRRIFSRLTVLENLQMGAFTRDQKGLGPDLDRVFHLFPRLKERIGQQGGTLSGGEQQMLAIGRGAHVRTAAAAPRRAVAGPRAHPHPAGLLDDQGHQRAGHDRPARRAERRQALRIAQPRLRPPDRQSWS
jgi:ABC-type transport system involved in cytochrome bd biosynthesis fused ATPase/permease subunit